jgi:histidine kinase
MLARLASLRLWMLVTTVGAAIIGLTAAYFAIGHLQNAQERVADRAKALRTARAIAAQAAAGAGPGRLQALQAVLPNDQIVVTRHGHVLFRGPALPGRDLEGTARAAFPGGWATVRDHTSPERASPLDVTLVLAAVIGFVILVAVVAASLISRAVRAPIERAIETADRLASGELSARMGSAGPEELVHLGRAFDSMAERLEHADRNQRQFLADLAHEIAHPLNTISGFALAFADGTLEMPEEREEAADLIVTETRRLEALLTDVRELTSLDLAQTVRAEPIDVDGFCDDLTARFRPAARAAGLDLWAAADAVTITSDRRLLETIIGNLLSNAIRYTPPGGRVTLTAALQHDAVTFSVRDTGIGIAREHQTRVFDRLYRVDAARARATGGTGLGLAISQRAAHTLGARLALSSEPGKGSEFRLILPSSRRRQEETAPVAAAEP